MAKHGRGLICLTLTDERCRQLGLQQMVRDNRTPHGTAFTVSIEAATGVTTGISADRARTVQAAVARHARPARRHRHPGPHLPAHRAEGRRADPRQPPPRPAATSPSSPGSSPRR